MKRTSFTRWEDVPVIIDLPYVSMLVGLTYEYLTTLCKKGKLPAFKIGNSWRVEKSDLIDWINKQKGA